MDKAKIDQGPPGPAPMVGPGGQDGLQMNMYIAQCNSTPARPATRHRARPRCRSEGMLTDAGPGLVRRRSAHVWTTGGRSSAFRRVLPYIEGTALVVAWRGADRPGRTHRSRHRWRPCADPVAARHQLRPLLGPVGHHELRAGCFRRRGLCHRAGCRDIEFSSCGNTAPRHVVVGSCWPACSRPSCLLSQAATTSSSLWHADRVRRRGLVSGWQYVGAGTACSSVKLLQFGAYEFVEGTGFLFPDAGLLLLSLPGALLSSRSGWYWRACGRTRSGWRSSLSRELSRRWCFRLRMVAGFGGALYSYHQGFSAWQHGPGLSTTAVLYCLLGDRAP